jgi:hypothetical protein
MQEAQGSIPCSSTFILIDAHTADAITNKPKNYIAFTETNFTQSTCFLLVLVVFIVAWMCARCFVPSAEANALSVAFPS